MPYLVDGNNVMAQTVGWHKDRRAARKRLIRDAASLVSMNRAKVKLVFDGLPDEEFPDGCKYKSVHILYARHGSDADTRIKELVTRSTHARDLIVVSSDRELVWFVQRRGAKVLSSGAFREMLDRSRQMADSSKDLAGQAQVDVQDWMSFFERQTGR